MSYQGRKPRGYENQEYPIHHFAEYGFSLNMEDTGKDTTIVTLAHYSEDVGTIESKEANPYHASYSDDAGVTVAPRSIIPRMKVSFTARIPKAAFATDALRNLVFNWMPMYLSYEDVMAMDETTGIEVEDILELEHNTDNRDVTPLASGTKLVGIAGNQPLSNVIGSAEAFGDWGLGTTAVLESVAFAKKSSWLRSLKYYTIAGKMKQICGRMHRVVLNYERPYSYYSNNFTHPKIKRSNPYMYCGILFHLPAVDNYEQLVNAGEVTNIPHLDIRLKVEYPEWNNQFDQTEQ